MAKKTSRGLTVSSMAVGGGVAGSNTTAPRATAAATSAFPPNSSTRLTARWRKRECSRCAQSKIAPCLRMHCTACSCRWRRVSFPPGPRQSVAGWVGLSNTLRRPAPVSQLEQVCGDYVVTSPTVRDGVDSEEDTIGCAERYQAEAVALVELGQVRSRPRCPAALRHACL